MATAYTLEQAIRDAIEKRDQDISDGMYILSGIFDMLAVLLQHEADKAAEAAIAEANRPRFPIG